MGYKKKAQETPAKALFELPGKWTNINPAQFFQVQLVLRVQEVKDIQADSRDSCELCDRLPAAAAAGAPLLQHAQRQQHPRLKRGPWAPTLGQSNI